MTGQAFRFGLVGVLNVLINFAVYAGLVWLGAHYLVASAVGTTLGILNSFVWSKFFVFRKEGDVLGQFAKTLMVYLVQTLVSWSGLIVLIEYVGLHPYVAYIANIIFVTTVSFLGLKFFAFGSRRFIKTDGR